MPSLSWFYDMYHNGPELSSSLESASHLTLLHAAKIVVLNQILTKWLMDMYKWYTIFSWHVQKMRGNVQRADVKELHVYEM